MTGHFVAFEGGEGSGKSTQARRLVERLGATALFTFEPGDTPVGAELRRLLLDTGELEVGARAEALLMAADRAQHVEEIIRPALEAGRTVVTDRFAASSVAYQGYGRMLSPAEVMRLSEWAAHGLSPDLVLLLEVPMEVSEARRDRTRDRMEGAGADFHRRVHDGFLAQAMEDPESWAVIDGDRAEDEVAEHIWQLVTMRFPDLS